MTSHATTLGGFIAELMELTKHTNRSLANVAGISEGAVRNILKHGIDDSAKDPDAHTLRRIAEALNVNPLKLYRLAGYLSPQPDSISLRAGYLAEVFDQLPQMKQDAVLGVLQAMIETPKEKMNIQEMREKANDALAGMDLQFPELIREAANELIIRYEITHPADIQRIEPDTEVIRNKWGSLPPKTRHRIIALIRHKIALNYDPTMVDPEWRD